MTASPTIRPSPMTATTDASPNPAPAQKKPRLAYAIATVLGVGYLRPAPGTYGSLVGVATIVLSAIFFLHPASVSSWFSRHPLSEAMFADKHFLVPGSDIHDNPGAALAIRTGASPRIAHNVFARNGLSERARASLIIEDGAEPSIVGNVFQGVAPKVFQTLGDAARLSIMRENWFPDGPVSRATTSAPRRGHQGR